MQNCCAINLKNNDVGICIGSIHCVEWDGQSIPHSQKGFSVIHSTGGAQILRRVATPHGIKTSAMKSSFRFRSLAFLNCIQQQHEHWEKCVQSQG
uniref:Uncharacterized protein n=1 Tax=Arion vulgaris TaxID=1028688 RepID=A0A0B7B2Q9_9EUPU